MVTSFGTNVIVVMRVHCNIFLYFKDKMEYSIQIVIPDTIYMKNQVTGFFKQKQKHLAMRLKCMIITSDIL